MCFAGRPVMVVRYSNLSRIRIRGSRFAVRGSRFAVRGSRFAVRNIQQAARIDANLSRCYLNRFTMAYVRSNWPSISTAFKLIGEGSDLALTAIVNFRRIGAISFSA